MNWIRIAESLPSDPKTHLLAERLGVRLAEAGGLIVFVLLNLPAHAPDGSFKGVPNSMLEEWARWRGTPGLFAEHFRAVFLNRRQVWAAWEKHNGAPLREAEAARQRAKRNRDAKAQATMQLALGPVLESSPERSANGSAHGSALRTNGRTNSRYGGRARPGTATATAPAFAPGHVLLPAQRFCAHCDGETVPVPGSKRMQQVHVADCPLHQEHHDHATPTAAAGGTR